ncbi:MAG: phosphopentomutase [Enterococcus sp.]
MKKRVITIVIDSLGIGELPDAEKYGDIGSNTLKTLIENDLKLTWLPKLGLYNAGGFPYKGDIIGKYAKLNEQSQGKDSTVGHWEIAGAVTNEALPLYPEGFPTEIVGKLESAFHRKILGNISASGTEIIEQLGPEHVITGYPIVYTSGDSVLQIAAHEEIIPLEEQYELCLKARKIMKDEHAVGRIVARPFVGSKGRYQRTANRKDFSLDPPRNILDLLREGGINTVSIGKISDIFNERSIQRIVHTKNNHDGMKALFKILDDEKDGFIFVNLVDTDQLYGHRRDIEGYVNAVQEIDQFVGDLLPVLTADDLLIITGDHGNDPGFSGTDHTREYTPVLIFDPEDKTGEELGKRETFADIAATIAKNFRIPYDLAGKSLL